MEQSVVLAFLDAEKGYDMHQVAFSFKYFRSLSFQCSALLGFIILIFQIITKEITSPGAKMQHGTHRGCFLIPVIFNLVLKPLICLTRQISEIKIICLTDFEYKILSEYIWGVFNDYQQSFLKIIDMLQCYKYSGCIIL